MMTIRKSAIVLALMSGLASGARGQTSSADQIAAGRDLARRVCGACHVVMQQRDELPVLAPPGPSFAVLARRPLLTQAWLREFLDQTTATWALTRRCQTRALPIIRSTRSSRS
jgi:mono/diheme cytochrome c family protein